MVPARFLFCSFATDLAIQGGFDLMFSQIFFLQEILRHVSFLCIPILAISKNAYIHMYMHILCISFACVNPI